MPCNSTQAQAILKTWALVPGSTMPQWVADLSGKVNDPNAQWLKIRGNGDVTTQCMPTATCTPGVAVAIHLEWPDGIPTTAGGVIDHEPALLDFLRTHPLS